MLNRRSGASFSLVLVGAYAVACGGSDGHPADPGPGASGGYGGATASGRAGAAGSSVSAGSAGAHQAGAGASASGAGGVGGASIGGHGGTGEAGSPPGGATSAGQGGAVAAGQGGAPSGGSDQGGASAAGSAGAPSLAHPDFNHGYPRIGAFQWYGGTDDWFSRFQFLGTWSTDTDAAHASNPAVMKSVRAKNPTEYIMATSDWNAGGEAFRGDHKQLPIEWQLRDSKGTPIQVYGTDRFADITLLCAPYTGTITPDKGAHNYDITNETFGEAIARVLFTQTDWTIFDGNCSDGSWNFPTNAAGKDIDLDRNGVNDWDEHGSKWIQDTWEQGQEATRAAFRKLYNDKFGDPNAKLLTYWTVGSDHMNSDVANGVGWESMYWNWPLKFSDYLGAFAPWQTGTPAPRVNYSTGDMFYDKGNAPPRAKDHFRLLRWLLLHAMLTDLYFISGDQLGHTWVNYYDEYDTDLGHPTSDPQPLANGAYVRFFERGASILNPTAVQISVTDDDLKTLTGYAGPYHRFQGNQDPTWNDGSPFTSVTMTSTKPSCIDDTNNNLPCNATQATQNVGDGIILVSSPKAVVADIIIDDAYPGTSPGSKDAVLTAGFKPDKANQSAWATSATQPSDFAVSHSATGGAGGDTATFTPTINVAGHYGVYEWHGAFKDASAAVPVTIAHAGGNESLVIDQTQAPGQWNLLGTYAFDAGGPNAAVVTNKATGRVLADAFMWRYVGP